MSLPKMCFVEFPSGWIPKGIGYGLHWKDASLFLLYLKLSKLNFVLLKVGSQRLKLSLKLKIIFEGRLN